MEKVGERNEVGVTFLQPYYSLTKSQWSGEYYDPFFTPTCHIKIIHTLHSVERRDDNEKAAAGRSWTKIENNASYPKVMEKFGSIENQTIIF